MLHEKLGLWEDMQIGVRIPDSLFIPVSRFNKLWLRGPFDILFLKLFSIILSFKLNGELKSQ